LLRATFRFHRTFQYDSSEASPAPLPAGRQVESHSNLKVLPWKGNSSYFSASLVVFCLIPLVAPLPCWQAGIPRLRFAPLGMTRFCVSFKIIFKKLKIEKWKNLD